MSLVKLYRRIQARRMEEKAIRDLLQRTDHELNDIGLLRSEIVTALRGR